MVHFFNKRVRVCMSIFPPWVDEAGEAHATNAGGVLTLVPDFEEVMGVTVEEEELVTGRALAVRIMLDEGVWIYHFNVHNFGLSREEKQRVVSRILQAKAEADLNPASRLVMVVWGL